MLKIIQSHPAWILPLFSPRPGSLFSPLSPEESAACITRDLCLRLFRHDPKWLAAEARKGTLVPIQGGLLQTTKWLVQYDNPVRRRIKRLRQTFASGAYVKLGFKPRWNRWTHIPRRYRATLRRAYPFYFTLRGLVKSAERMHRQRLEVQQAEAAAAAAASRVTFCAGQSTGRTDQPSSSKDVPPVRQRWSDGVVIRRPSVDLDTLYRPELLQPTATQDSAFFASFARL